MSAYDFKLNRDEVIKFALQKLGVIGQGQTPSADQITDSARALNVLVKAWEADGLPLWAIKQDSFSVVAGTASYSIGEGKTVNIPKPLKVYQAWMRETSSGVDVPMYLLTRQQYNILANKTVQGSPTQFYYEPLNEYGNFYIYPTADTTTASTKKCYFLYQAPFSDFDSDIDYPDFPQEWIRALGYGLAADLTWDHGYPSKDRNDLIAMADRMKAEALAFTQEEGSFFFQIDRRR